MHWFKMPAAGFAAAAAVLLAGGTAARAAAITLHRFGVLMYAREGRGYDAAGAYVNYDRDEATAAGPGTVSAEAVYGGNSASGTFSFAVDGTRLVTDATFRHARTGAYQSLAQTAGHLHLTVGDRDVAYDLSGLYQTTSGPTFEMHQVLYVYDETADSRPYVYNYNYARGGPPTLTHPRTPTTAGQGRSEHEREGIATGTLLAGHTYNLVFDSQIMSTADVDDGGATARGVVGAAALLPDPAGGGLAVIGLAGLLGRRRRRGRRAAAGPAAA